MELEPQARTLDQRRLSRLRVVLWLIGAVVVAFAAWLGPALARPDIGDAPTPSPTHYVLSLAVWFVIFGIAYSIIRACRLPFGQTPALIQFGLMATGTALILSPPFLLVAMPPPVTGEETIAWFRTMSAVSTGGYGLTLLSFIVFIGALGLCVFRTVRKGRA